MLECKTSKNEFNIKKHLIAGILLVLLLAFSIYYLPFVVNADEGDRWYCGYYYIGESGAPGTGVAAYIKTINRTVTGERFHARWPAIIMSYSYMYWVQVGVSQGSDTNNILKWYVDKNDTGGYTLWWRSPSPWGSPDENTFYRYYIYKYDSTKWMLGVSGVDENYLTTDPVTIIDYQAFTETNNPDVNIDDTEFDYLEYKFQHDWRLWEDHVPREDEDYELTEINDYTFEADGGS